MVVFLESALVWSSPDAAVSVVFPALGLIYVGTGLIAWRRRPQSAMGPLITAGGSVFFLVSLANVDIPILVAVGEITATVPLAHLVHLLLAFPSGRLVAPINRAVTISGYVVCVALQAPLYLFSGEGPPFDLLSVGNRPDLVAAGRTVQAVCGLTVMLATSAILVQRLRRAPPLKRRVLLPLDTYGIVAAMFVPVSAAILHPRAISPLVLVVVQQVLFAGVPVAFAASVLRGGFARTADVEDLASWLGAVADTRPPIQWALSQALGDPSVEVRFPEVGHTVRGLPHSRDDGRSGRGVVDVKIAGRLVAQIDYDATLHPDVEPVAAAGRVAALALDRERLLAELVERTQELGQSRTRLVETEDRERRRIAQDLHDGIQVQLVLLSLRAAQLAETDGANRAVIAGAHHMRIELDTAAAELRRLVHGLMPALLIERGLFAAAEDLVDLMPTETSLDVRGSDRELSGPVESTAYFVVAEALTNVVKHARASRARVDLTRMDGFLRVEVADDGRGGARLGYGHGLRGLADRLDVLGGTLRVDSEADKGTRVIAEVPCVP